MLSTAGRRGQTAVSLLEVPSRDGDPGLCFIRTVALWCRILFDRLRKILEGEPLRLYDEIHGRNANHDERIAMATTGP